MSNKMKNEKFRKLAEKRMNKTLKQLDLIGNLSNHYIYNYKDDEIKHIMNALDKKLKEVKERFYNNLKKDGFKFSEK